MQWLQKNAFQRKIIKLNGKKDNQKELILLKYERQNQSKQQ